MVPSDSSRLTVFQPAESSTACRRDAPELVRPGDVNWSLASGPDRPGPLPSRGLTATRFTARCKPSVSNQTKHQLSQHTPHATDDRAIVPSMLVMSLDPTDAHRSHLTRFAITQTGTTLLDNTLPRPPCARNPTVPHYPLRFASHPIRSPYSTG
jgi:hypothetical protein